MVSMVVPFFDLSKYDLGFKVQGLEFQVKGPKREPPQVATMVSIGTLAALARALTLDPEFETVNPM